MTNTHTRYRYPHPRDDDDDDDDAPGDCGGVFFSPPGKPIQQRREKHTTVSSKSSSLSVAKLTPRTGLCASALTIMRTSKPTPNTRRAVARIRATHERKNTTTTTRKKQTRAKKETKGTTFDRKKKKKVLREEVASSNESALAKVIANKKSVTSEEIVETIRNATFGELRMCFPLVFDGNVTSSNNKEWLQAVFTRKMVTDTAYEFVPRSKYSSTNRLKKRKEREEAMNSDINNATLKKNEYTTTSIPPLPQDEDRIVVFTVEVGHQEQGEQHQRNDNARGYNVTGANTNDDDADEEAKQLSSFFTNASYPAVSPLVGTRL